MASFRVHNAAAISSLLYGADYLAKKYRQAEAEYGKPMQAIETELVDENGQVWKLSFGPVPPPQTTE